MSGPSAALSKATSAHNRIDDIVGFLHTTNTSVTSITNALQPLINAGSSQATFLAGLSQTAHLANDNSTTDTWDSAGRGLWNSLKASVVDTGIMA
jgi:hypothetical protein